MEFFKKTDYDFMGIRKWAGLFSVVIIIGSIAALLVNGLNLGLDFTGGTQIEVAYSKPADIPTIRKQLSQAGFSEAVVQSYGSAEAVLISISPKDEHASKTIGQDIASALPEAKIQRVDFIGPQIGKELMTKGALAFFIALLATLAYIALRFEYKLALSAILALLHDPILILGIFALFHIEFNLPAFAALLTVIGYSLNDTVVVFDRVRENFRKLRKISTIDLMNLSINQTLSRTVMTSGLTLLVVIALFLYGGATIHSFSIALIIGIVVGTYSSIYVAGSLAVKLGLNRKDFITPQKNIDD